MPIKIGIVFINILLRFIAASIPLESELPKPVSPSAIYIRSKTST